MKVIQSEILVKGYRNGNCYIIIKNENDNFNVYQLFCDVNKDVKVKDIKKIIPSLKHLPDVEIIVSFTNEKFEAFLLLHDIDVKNMNVFRIGLKNKQILL
ncbi:hypothetical protein P4I83_32340 [Bacillus cereus]|nr:hypothetical protein [Bacillus cereus]